TPSPAIADGGGSYGALNVAAFGAPLSGIVLTTSITHTTPSDLLMVLRAPGTVFTGTISSYSGGAFNNAFLGTRWDDRAGLVNPPGPVTDNDFSQGGVETPLVPEESMSAWNGHDPGGGGGWYF